VIDVPEIKLNIELNLLGFIQKRVNQWQRVSVFDGDDIKFMVVDTEPKVFGA